MSFGGKLKHSPVGIPFCYWKHCNVKKYLSSTAVFLLSTCTVPFLLDIWAEEWSSSIGKQSTPQDASILSSQSDNLVVTEFEEEDKADDDGLFSSPGKKSLSSGHCPNW